MHAMQARCRRIGLILALAGCTGHVLCAIPPSQVHSRTPSSWGPEDNRSSKAAQVIITLGSKHGVAVDQIEVGVSEHSRVALVSDIDAQLAVPLGAETATPAS